MQTSELIRKVRRLEIRSRHLVEDVFSGQTESVFKGRGIEFEEVRPYVPGDEIRDLDWNVTARLGEPYVKRFVEQRELTVLFVVDISRSMRFGTAGSEKRELAAELVAVLGFAALRNDDRIGLVLAAEQVEHYVPPARGRSHLLRVLRDVLTVTPERPGTHLSEVARFVLRTTHRRSVVLWISDFEDTLDPRDWRVMARRHDVTAVALRDPRDEWLPAAGWVELEDLETGRRKLVNTSSARVREAYRRDARKRWQEAETALARSRCPVLQIRTDQSYLPVLLRYFARRRRGGRSVA